MRRSNAAGASGLETTMLCALWLWAALGVGHFRCGVLWIRQDQRRSEVLDRMAF